MCNNTDQSEESLTVDLGNSELSLYESKSTSESKTAKQSVVASLENEELKAIVEPESKVSQPEVNGLVQDLKANSGVDNKLDDVEASSAKCNTNVVNKECKSHLDRLDQLGVGINATVVKVVKSNQKEDVERVIALLKSRKRDGHIPNLAGYFVQALKQNWGSEVSNTEDTQATFRYWYQLARELGNTQVEDFRDGEQWVLLSGNWEKWESTVNRGDSMEYLRKVLGRSQQR